VVKDEAARKASADVGSVVKVPVSAGSKPGTPRMLRRGIFFDIENSSRPEHVSTILSHLEIDRATRSIDLFAMGNWQVASPETARLLARHGAHLVHSAPAAGVKDWSDLRIAVAIGIWLASARPDDSVEVVTDDQAFQAVGDVAAGLGVEFRQLSFRALGMSRAPTTARHPGKARRPRRSASRRPTGDDRVRTPRSAARQITSPPGQDGHDAPPDEIRAAVEVLLEASPTGGTLDALANLLKSRGFARPAGSPRLVTSLRRLKEIEVTRAGIVRRAPLAASS
jgi:hypothetical protein